VGLEFFQAGHPVPTETSVAAGRRVLEVVGHTGPDGVVLVLLSGGASAASAVPVTGLTLADKIGATEALLRGGVAIAETNCVRKHLSAIKGGRLAAVSGAAIVTLAVSDVVGPVADDPAVIGSGPTAPDPTTYADALAVADSPAVRPYFPVPARSVLERGCRGQLPETPKPGDPRLGKSVVRVIGNRMDAVRAAADEAEALGYTVAIVDKPIVGEARHATMIHQDVVRQVARGLRRPGCIVSAGESTVTVTGPGRGGRNQEFALAAVRAVGEADDDLLLASVGTDGIDGPTDAAGAIVDRSTLRRALAHGLDPMVSLDRNDSYPFFDTLGDLVRTGPTTTNVGDLQIVLVGHRDS
jgi:glycerate-2-kinase